VKILTLLLLTLSLYADSVYNYETGKYVDIETDGTTATIYDYDSGKYSYEDDVSTHSEPIVTYDDETGTYSYYYE